MVEAAASGGWTPQVVSAPVANTQSSSSRSGGGSGVGGGGDERSGFSVKDYVDAQDEKTRAQNQTEFVKIESKLDNLKVPSIWQIAGLMVAAIGFAFGILAFASDRFDGGLSAMSLLDSANEEQQKRDDAQDQKLDQIIQIVEQIRDDSQTITSNGKD